MVSAAQNQTQSQTVECLTGSGMLRRAAYLLQCQHRSRVSGRTSACGASAGGQGRASFPGPSASFSKLPFFLSSPSDQWDHRPLRRLCRHDAPPRWRGSPDRGRLHNAVEIQKRFYCVLTGLFFLLLRLKSYTTPLKKCKMCMFEMENFLTNLDSILILNEIIKRTMLFWGKLFYLFIILVWWEMILQ